MNGQTQIIGLLLKKIYIRRGYNEILDFFSSFFEIFEGPDEFENTYNSYISRFEKELKLLRFASVGLLSGAIVTTFYSELYFATYILVLIMSGLIVLTGMFPKVRLNITRPIRSIVIVWKKGKMRYLRHRFKKKYFKTENIEALLDSFWRDVGLLEPEMLLEVLTRYGGKTEFGTGDPRFFPLWLSKIKKIDGRYLNSIFTILQCSDLYQRNELELIKWLFRVEIISIR